MTRGRLEIRQLAERMLADLVRQVEEAHGGAPVTVAQLRSACDGYLRSPAFTGLLSEAHTRMIELAAVELLRQKRGDPFQRLMVHPLSDAFATGQLSRDILPNYFSFLHLVLGDSQEMLAQRCRDIVEDLRAGDPLVFSWDRFYDDPRAKQVQWTVLARVAETFRRFDARRDWFIGLMQNRPQAISLGSNMFQPRPRHDDAASVKPFGALEFRMLFDSLFLPLRHLSPLDRVAFQRALGAPPEEIFGHLFANLWR